MALNGRQRILLELIGELSGHSVVTSVLDSVVIRRSGLPADDVNMYLDQLEDLGLIAVGLKGSGAEFGLINIARDGLKENSGKPDITQS